MVNSVSGKQESMDKVFPLIRKYGGVVIGLTLDEEGIPADAEGRVRIAERIISEAAKYGIKKKDIVIDALAMTISSEPDGAKVTLETLRRLRDEVGGQYSTRRFQHIFRTSVRVLSSMPLSIQWR